MKNLEIALILLVAIIHFYFLYLEMILWTKPQGMKAFGLKKEFAEKTKILAANQGLYNGFLAAGLLWSLISKIPSATLFFLFCVVVAGIYGSISLKKRRVLYIQAIPALLAIAIIFFNKL